MPQKPRYRKTPMQLWVVDNRDRLRLADADIAKATGVTIDTARGWMSRGRPGEDKIAALERLFGQPAPRNADAESGDPAATVAAIDRLTDAVRALVAETHELRKAQQERDEEMGELLGLLTAAATSRAETRDGDGSPLPSAGAR